MNLDLHHKGQDDYFDTVKQNVVSKIKAIKNSHVLTSKTKKATIKALNRTLLKEKKEAGRNNY